MATYHYNTITQVKIQGFEISEFEKTGDKNYDFIYLTVFYPKLRYQNQGHTRFRHIVLL